jgi:type II secretory pathway component PulK
MYYSRQRGMALLVVLSVIAVIVMIVAQLSERLDFTVRRTMSIENSQMAFNEALGYEAKVKHILQNRNQILESMGPQVAQLMSGDVDTYFIMEQFNLFLEQGIALEEGSLIQSLSGRAKDLHSCFNLNSIGRDGDPQASGGRESAGSIIVVDENTQPPEPTVGFAMYRRLIEQLVPLDADPLLHENLTNALKDWVDSDRRGEYEETAYEEYRPAIGYMASLTELKAVKHYLDVVEVVDEEDPTQVTQKTVFELLKDYVCVRGPGDNSVALNPHAIGGEKPELIMSFFSESNDDFEEKVAGFLQEQSGAPDDLEAMVGAGAGAGAGIPSKVEAINDFKALMEKDEFKELRAKLVHEKLKALVPEENSNPPPTENSEVYITPQSEYFELTGKVLMETGGVVLTTMFQKSQNSGQPPQGRRQENAAGPTIRVVRRTLGDTL